MKKRFSEEQIIGFLREADAGLPIKELCRQHGFSEASYYLWRRKFGGMNVSDAKRLKEVEAENTRLKKLLAEAMLEIEVTREALRKMYGPSRFCKHAKTSKSVCVNVSGLSRVSRFWRPGHDGISASGS